MQALVDFVSAAGPGAFVVRRFTGRESLGGLDEYRLDLLCARPDARVADLLGTVATVALAGEAPGDPPRWFHCHVTHVQSQGAVRSAAFGDNVAFVHGVVLHPGLWFLSRQADCRVHRDVTLADLLAQRLAPAGAMGLDADLRPSEWREQVVQYRETALQFAARLAEHLGATWCVRHARDGHRLRLTDRPGASTEDGPARPLVMAAPGDRAGRLRAFSFEQALHETAFLGGDRHAPTPAVPLSAAADASAAVRAGAPPLCTWDYPLGVTTPEAAAAQARIRIEALACAAVRGRGTAVARDLQVGGRVRIQRHPLPALDGEWLVTAHTFVAVNAGAGSGPGAGAHWRCDFEAVPARVPYRPPRRTPRPVLAGIQPARVVADFRQDIAAPLAGRPVGERQGRVRVAFPWDRAATPSCWARVARPWGGAGRGFQAMPRLGDDVLVQFEHGDPDRPVVVGHAHGPDARPPYALPAQAAVTGLRTASLDAQGRSVPGRFNELRFDDTLGAEEVRLRAQRDLEVRVVGDRRAAVGGASRLAVTGDHVEEAGADRLARVGRRLRVEAGGDLLLSAGGRIEVQAAGGVTLRCEGSVVQLDASGVRIDGPSVSLPRGS